MAERSDVVFKVAVTFVQNDHELLLLRLYFVLVTLVFILSRRLVSGNTGQQTTHLILTLPTITLLLLTKLQPIPIRLDGSCPDTAVPCRKPYG
ncbi:hypothetical protein B0I37DRAFT_170831 [Chaetomium sp. MPI-CAGE-AT-0009]|nr:hypothetical protein B0I37DRAFT_170831 [Chaetomium sp. MPI-CAGE-AT-0009]